MIIGESAAKSLYGSYIRSDIPMTRQDVTPLQLNGELNLIDNLRAIGPDNVIGKLNIPFEAMGLGYIAEASDKVLASNSLADNMPAHLIKADRIWKGLEAKVKQLSEGKDNWIMLENEMQARQLFNDAVDQTGYDMTDGGYGLAAILLKNGAMSHHNPIIRKSVNSLFNSKIFSILRRNDVETGSSSVIIPDINNTHLPPMFRTIKRDMSEEAEIIVRSPNQSESTVDFSASPDKVFRVVTKFGEMSYPKHLGDKGIEKIENVDLVVKFEGRDIRFRINEDGPIDLTDHLFDVINHNPEKRFVGNSYGDETINSPKDNAQFMSDLERVGNILKTWINDADANQSLMTMSGLLELLETGSYEVINRNTNERSFKQLNKKDLAFLREHDIGIGMNNIAKKSFDVGFSRVKEFLSAEWGNHMIGNNHEIRVMHQRDNDGDKMYTFFSQDSETVDWGIRRMGIKTDYKQYARHTFDANPLGLDNQGNIGAVTEDVGFTNLKNQIAQDKFAIGEAITLKNVLNWANNIGFEINIDYGSTGGTPQKVGFTNLSDVDGIINHARSVEYETAIQQGDVNQNAVDFWEPSWISGQLKNVLLYGDVPQHLIDKAYGETGRGFQGAFEDSVPFQYKSDDYRTELDIMMNRDIAEIIVGTLKKAYSTFTDPFDDGGQFTPTEWYIDKVSGNVESLLQNPNQFIVGQLLSKHRGDRAMIKQVVDRFYGDPKGRRGSRIFDQKNYDMFLSRIFRGGNIGDKVVQNKVISIKNGTRGLIKDYEENVVGKGYENWKDLMEMETAGYALVELKQRQLLKDIDYFGELSNTGKKLDYNQIIERTGNLMNRVMLYKAYFDGQEPSLKMDESPDTEDYFSAEFTTHKPKKSMLSFENVEMRSAAYHLLNKEASAIQVELAKMDGSPFKVNQFELEVLTNRLNDLNSSMQVLEKLAMKNMVHKNMMVNIVTPRGRRAIYRNYGKNTTHMYGIKGRFSKDDLQNMNFSDLRYFGPVKPKGGFKGHQGWTYIEVKRPLIERYFGDTESVHSFALYKAVSKTLNVSKIAESSRRTELFDDLWVLQQQVNSDYAFAKNAPRQYSKKSWEFASQNDIQAIQEFMVKWKADDGVGNVLFEEGDVGLELMKLIMLPNAASGQFVKVEGFELPYLVQNNRLTSALLGYLKKAEIITAEGGMPLDLELIFRAQRKYVNEIYGYKHQDPLLDDITQSHELANDITAQAFDKAGVEHGSILRYLRDEYDFIDPSVSQRLIETNSHGPIYDKYDIHGKKVRFIKNKGEVWGCS